MDHPITAYEMGDLIASQLSIINESWNFFLTIHLGIIGLLILARHYIPVFAKMVVIVAYIGFTCVNLSGQLENYEMLRSLHSDAAALVQDGAFDTASGPILATGVAYSSYVHRMTPTTLFAVYGVASVFTLLCLLLVNTFSGWSRREEAEDSPLI